MSTTSFPNRKRCCGKSACHSSPTAAWCYSNTARKIPRCPSCRIRVSLKPDGRMVLLEYRKEDPQVPILPAHKMSVAEVKAEIEPEGFRLEKTLENLPRQHILIFRKNTM